MRTEIAKPLTAAQIAKGKNLPPRLVTIGKEVEAKVSKFRTYEAKASDMAISIRQLLTEAATYCDKSGFNTFRKKFCPSLGRSRAYELLAIASGKKSADDTKAVKAARQAKYVARLKAAGRPSVMENVVPLVPRDARFKEHVLELTLLIADATPTKFAGVALPVGDLAKLGRFLLAVADLPKTKKKAVKVSPQVRELIFDE